MAGCLFGLETEYAMGGATATASLRPREAVRLVMEEAHRSLVYLTDSNGSLYLANGARLYTDCGWHPEFCTPECRDPWDLVRYVRAGERILVGLADRARVSHPEIADLWFLRTNVDYGGSLATWGCHESYLSRKRPMDVVKDLLPHLAARVVFCGAGGFDPQSAGIRFTLSPRAGYFTRAVTTESTADRGLFHLRDRALSEAYHRIHVTCGESLASDVALWLKVGTTALILAMADADRRPSEGLELADPVQAFHAFAADPTCRAAARLTTGRLATAVEIERGYLQQVRAACGASFMPPWAADVCRLWGRVLDLIERRDPALHAMLDWAIKEAVTAGFVAKGSISWPSIGNWTAAIREARARFGAWDPRALPAADEHGRDVARELASFLRGKGLDPDRAGEISSLRHRLFELDTKFGRLGDDGLFAALERQPGVLTHRVAGARNVDEAIERPPESGRARIRGDVIRRFARHVGFIAGWDSVCHTGGSALDLSDPFVEAERWS